MDLIFTSCLVLNHSHHCEVPRGSMHENETRKAEMSKVVHE